MNIYRKVKLQCFGHLMPTDNSLEKSLMLRKIEGRRRGHQRMRWLDSITSAMNMNLGKLWEVVRDREVCCAAVHGFPKSWTRQGNRTTRLQIVPPWPVLSCHQHDDIKHGVGKRCREAHNSTVFSSYTSVNNLKSRNDSNWLENNYVVISLEYLKIFILI